MASITNPQNDRRTLNHRGTEVGADNVSRLNNVADSWTPVLEWTMPDKFERVDYAAGMHPTRAELRAEETITGTTGDDTVVSLATNIVPVGGEEDIADQDFPVVVAYNDAQGVEVDIADVDYAANEVTLATDPADTETVYLWPVIADGLIQYRIEDQFGHLVASLDEWGTPMHVFADHRQLKSDSQIHLVGRASLEDAEVMAVYVNSPDVVVWDTDATEYPLGQYVSSFQQRVDVSI